jgi:hypothetical protein
MRQELLRQLALGVNLPPSVVLGIEGMNDWSAWQADDSSIRQYADPDILEILESLTESWYRPLLEAASVPGASEFLLYRDLAPAVVPADRSKLALDGYDAILISGEATRREIGFDETDAPSPEEVEERIRIAQAIKVAPVPTGPEQGPGGPMRAALLAAGPATTSGERLTRIDQDLLAYVIAQAEAAIDQALEVAGRKLKASVKQNGLKELVAAVPLRMVAATLGPSNVALYQTLGELVPEGSFASVIDRIGRRIAAAQEAARREVERLTGGEVEEDGEEAEDRRSALSIILRALVAAAAAALFTPDPSPDPADLGEVGDTRVPVAELREALSVAGGGASSFEGTKASELVGNGARTVRQLEVAAVRTLSFVWVYGSEPRQEFPPHRSLDGAEFDTWESEQLSVDPLYSWLGRGFYRPGDHRGCRCSYERVMTISALAPEELAASV